MIRELANVELVVRAMRNNSKSAMLRMPSFWNQGIVYCTCGHLLKESDASQHFHQWRWDASSI